jgi:hypothetical protein
MLKATTDEATETQSLAQTPHSGYIVICFKLLDNTKVNIEFFF